MRARGAPQVGALDDEIVLRKDPAIDPDLQWQEGNRGRNGDADAQLLGGCGGRRQQECCKQQGYAKAINHQHDCTHFAGTLSRAARAGVAPRT
jgi:hypothetical protein